MEIKIGNVYYDRKQKDTLTVIGLSRTVFVWNCLYEKGKGTLLSESYLAKYCILVEKGGEEKMNDDKKIVKNFFEEAIKKLDKCIKKMDKLSIFDGGESAKENKYTWQECIDPREHPITPGMVGKIVLVDSSGDRYLMTSYEKSFEPKPVISCDMTYSIFGLHKVSSNKEDYIQYYYWIK